MYARRGAGQAAYDKDWRGVDFVGIWCIMLTQRCAVSTSDSMCAKAHDIMVEYTQESSRCASVALRP